MTLIITSGASAQLSIWVNGFNTSDSQVNLRASETVNISIVGDGLTPPNTQYFLINVPPGCGTMSGGVLGYPGEFRPVNPDELAILQSLGYNTINAYSIGFFGEYPLAGTLVDGITFHSESYFDALLTLMNLTWVQTGEDENGDPIYSPQATIMDTQVIHTPEPMTIVLLGLGGLFLRRRK